MEKPGRSLPLLFWRNNEARITYPRWLICWVGAVTAFFIALNFIFPPPLSDARNVSPVVSDHSGRWVAGFTVEDGRWRIPADLSEIDPRFIDRLIAIEDKRFWHHSGVDVPAIIRAGRSWLREGTPVSGASTITMQLVRQLEPRPRNLRSKAAEAVRAVQYELWMSKAEILESYLTHVSYGGNIEGVHAASKVYFGKPPYQLTDGEIALLIALPQAPEARRPDLRPKAATAGRDKILDKLAAAQVISDIQAKEAQELEINVTRQAMPEQAWLTAKGLSNKGISDSALDSDLQAKIEALTAQFIAPFDSPVNTAVIVVENKSMAVRAHIASADRARPGGWIDMTDRARSPGSTLKPFIYGLAMDDGIISAGSFVRDAPTRFGSYQPENFNRRYHGDVRIFEALRHSLNVPAVSILDQVGGPRLEATLTAAGVDITRLGSRSEAAGLALALGGAGVTVNDLAVIYAGLANGGEAKALRWSQGQKPKPYRLLSEKTAGDITRILRQAPTPKGRVPAWLAQNAPPIAYKTGTSYGFRDAWAAGYTDEYTVIVWVGRADGAPRNGQTGRIAAAPFLFDIFAALPSSGRSSAFTRDDAAPAGLKRAKDGLGQAPQILFPPDGAQLLSSAFGQAARGFAFSARTSAGELRFYVNGAPVPRAGGQAIWRPETPGFYEVAAVDAKGRTSTAKIEVVGIEQLAGMR